MLISANELNALLKRVFEGMGYEPGHYEDAAALVSALQLQGEDGLGELERAVAMVADRERPLGEVVRQDADVLVVECHGRSALNCLPGWVELARVQGVKTLQVLGCHNRKFVLGLLGGGSIEARWENGRDELHVARIEAGERYPDYRVYRGHLPGMVRQSLTLTFGAISVAVEPPVRHVSPEDFALARAQALENGTEISTALWQRLNGLAEAVLVASSERSRSGAGGR